MKRICFKTEVKEGQRKRAAVLAVSIEYQLVTDRQTYADDT